MGKPEVPNEVLVEAFELLHDELQTSLKQLNEHREKEKVDCNDPIVFHTLMSAAFVHGTSCGVRIGSLVRKRGIEHTHVTEE